MTGQAWLLLGAIVTAVGGVVTTWLMIRQQGKQSKTTDAQQIIDQLQEMAAAADAKHQRDLADLRGEVGEIRGRLTRMEDRELASFDYMYALRDHIDQRRDPPPPPWPDVLLHRT